MFMQKKIRVLIVGFGNIAKTHAALMMRIKAFEFAGVVDARPEAVAAAQQFRVDVPVYATLADALAAGSFDAAILCTPHHVHYEQCTQCLSAGLHVLCEKPVCLSMEDFDRLAALSARSNRVLVAGHMMRYWPNVVWARHQVQSGVIGEIRHVIRDRITQQSDAGGRAWAHNPTEAGGWLLYGTGIHEIDALLYMTGASLVRAEAFACVNNAGWNDWDELSVCGMLSGGTVFNLNQTLNGGEFLMTTRLIGTKGVIVLQGDSVAVLNGEKIFLAQNNAFHSQLLSFARTVLQGEENRAAIGAVRDTMAALDTINKQIHGPAPEGSRP